MNNKLKAQLSRITGYDESEVMHKKMKWLQAYDARQSFLAKVREAGLRFSDYSRAVAEYDRNNMHVSVV